MKQLARLPSWGRCELGSTQARSGKHGGYAVKAISTVLVTLAILWFVGTIVAYFAGRLVPLGVLLNVFLGLFPLFIGLSLGDRKPDGK